MWKKLINSLDLHLYVNHPLIVHVLPQVQYLDSFHPHRKDNDTHVGFLEDVMLYVIKGFLPMRMVEFI
jgi:hypothetical protein